jgi:hypothetical protein
VPGNKQEGRQKMNWYKISVDGVKQGQYSCVGCSSNSLDDIMRKVSEGKFIRLDNLLYLERGVVKNWEDWDPNVIPSVCINPSRIVMIMQFKDDPRNSPKYKNQPS